MWRSRRTGEKLAREGSRILDRAGRAGGSDGIGGWIRSWEPNTWLSSREIPMGLASRSFAALRSPHCRTWISPVGSKCWSSRWMLRAWLLARGLLSQAANRRDYFVQPESRPKPGGGSGLHPPGVPNLMRHKTVFWKPVRSAVPGRADRVVSPGPVRRDAAHGGIGVLCLPKQENGHPRGIAIRWLRSSIREWLNWQPKLGQTPVPAPASLPN